MKLSNSERETVILFNEAEGVARIETFSAHLLRQLRKVATCDGVSCDANEKGYGVFTVPKSMIKVRAPRKMTEKQKRAAIDNLKIASTAPRLPQHREQTPQT